MAKKEVVELQIGADGIAVILLKKPPMNTFDGNFTYSLQKCLKKCDEDDAVRVVIITAGPGSKAFCAGMDLEAAGASTFSYAPDAADSRRDQGGVLSLAILSVRKPVIAAINGAAVGVGITMTLAADMRVVAADAKIGFVFARRGIMNEACSTYFLPRIVGMQKALELSLTGRVFQAKDEPSLFNYVVPTSKDVLPKAMELAREMLQCSPLSLAFIKKSLYYGFDQGDVMKSHLLETEGVRYLGKQSDSLEGVGAFLEKRTPVFRSSVSRDIPDFISKL